MLFLGLFSCRVPKNFQKGKPFVYKTTIKVEGKIKGDEKQDLVQRLGNQLDDSLQTKTVTGFNWPPPLIANKLNNPPVFDTANVGRSIVFMKALLNANGFYAPEIRDTVIYTIKHEGQPKEEDRVTIHFTVKPGKQLIFDSVGFSLSTPELQMIAMDSREH